MKYIKIIVTMKGQELYYKGDGQWFGRVKKEVAEKGLKSGEFVLFSKFDKRTNTEDYFIMEDLYKTEEEKEIEELNKKTNEMTKYINKNNHIDTVRNHLIFKLEIYVVGVLIAKYKSNIDKLNMKLKNSKKITSLYVDNVVKQYC